MLRNFYKKNIIQTHYPLSIYIKTLHNEIKQTIVSNETVLEPVKKFDFTNFTSKDIEKILYKINNNTSEELNCYGISNLRVQKLLNWKIKNGRNIENLEDIMQIQGFGPKVAERFYRSLLTEPEKKKKNEANPTRLRTSNFITPNMDALQQQNIKSCIALRLGITNVTWSRLELPPLDAGDIPCILTDWHFHDIHSKKMHLNDLVQNCLYINHMIPTADCYILENPQMIQASTNPGSVEQQNINIQKAQMTAILCYSLSARRDLIKMDGIEDFIQESLTENDAVNVDKNIQPTKNEPNVFYLRRFLSARLFNHLIGTERVSSEETVLKLMRTHYNRDTEMEDYVNDDEEYHSKVDNFKNRRLIEFSAEFRSMFSKAERIQREFLSQSLLLNLAFLRLILLQDAESIAILTRNPNKNNIET